MATAYPDYAQKADDICHLLADLYTAFRNMNLNEIMVTPEGYEVMRAMPRTTLIRHDMVELALYVIPQLRCPPLSPRQIELLIFLGGFDKKTTVAEAAEILLECERDLISLAHGLREHEYYLADDTMLAYPYENQPVDFKKPAVKNVEIVVPPRLEPAPLEPELGPIGEDEEDDEEDELDDDLSEFDDDLLEEAKSSSTTKRMKNVEALVDSEATGEETKAIARVELEMMQAKKERQEAKRRQSRRRYGQAGITG